MQTSEFLKALTPAHEVLFFEDGFARVVHLFFRTYQDAQTWIIQNRKRQRNPRYLCRKWSQAHIDDLDLTVQNASGLAYLRGVSKQYRPLPGRYT